jgi:hypothetical protein
VAVGVMVEFAVCSNGALERSTSKSSSPTFAWTIIVDSSITPAIININGNLEAYFIKLIITPVFHLRKKS